MSQKSHNDGVSFCDSTNDNESAGFRNEALELSSVGRAARELERQKHKQYAESQKETRLAAILQMQESYQNEQQVETKDDVPGIHIASQSPDSGQHSEFGYPTATHSRFSWIDSMNSSLNSSFTSQSRLIIDSSRTDEQLQVEGRIKTEELVKKVNEELRKIQQKPVQEYGKAATRETNKYVSEENQPEVIPVEVPMNQGCPQRDLNSTTSIHEHSVGGHDQSYELGIVNTSCDINHLKLPPHALKHYIKRDEENDTISTDSAIVEIVKSITSECSEDIIWSSGTEQVAANMTKRTPVIDNELETLQTTLVKQGELPNPEEATGSQQRSVSGTELPQEETNLQKKRACCTIS